MKDLFDRPPSRAMEEVRRLEIQLKGCRTRLLNLRRRIEEMEREADGQDKR